MRAEGVVLLADAAATEHRRCVMRKQQPGMGVLRALSRVVREHARRGEKAYDRYLATDDFKRRWDALLPQLRLRAVQLIVAAEELCRERDPLPPRIVPKPLGQHPSARWTDAAEQARLRAAWAKTGNIEATARLLGVTTGSARLALKRYVLIPATSDMRLAA